jgi:hypothetical protein
MTSAPVRNAMSDDVERIRQQMQHVRQDMGEGVQEVVHGARQLSDWKYYVRKHPWACVGSAFALGFLATPARRRILSGNVDIAQIVEQLKQQGLDTGSLGMGLAAGAGGGLASRAFSLLWPILLRNAGAMVAQHLAARGQATPPDPTTAEAQGGP